MGWADDPTKTNAYTNAHHIHLPFSTSRLFFLIFFRQFFFPLPSLAWVIFYTLRLLSSSRQNARHHHEKKKKKTKTIPNEKEWGGGTITAGYAWRTTRWNGCRNLAHIITLQTRISQLLQGHKQKFLIYHISLTLYFLHFFISSSLCGISFPFGKDTPHVTVGLLQQSPTWWWRGVPCGALPNVKVHWRYFRLLLAMTRQPRRPKKRKENKKMEEEWRNNNTHTHTHTKRKEEKYVRRRDQNPGHSRLFSFLPLLKVCRVK